MKKILLLIAVVFATNNLFAETGKELLDACEKAMGHGRIAEFKTMKIECSVSQMGMNIGMVLYQRGKNMRMETSMMGQEMVYVVTDNNTFFMLKPAFQELPFEQAEQVTSQFSIVMPNISEFRENAKSGNIELIGVEDFHGKSAKKVKIADEDGESFLFIDPISNWLVGLRVPAMQFDLIFDAMKRVKGFVYPSAIKITQAGQTAAEITINKFEVDIDLPDSLFTK